MASFAAACRLSARLTSRQLRQESSARGFRTSTACLAAQNFTMPALSPTMTEGNIAKWAVKEGDSFVAGDILLEIETDKASMDVEAQDDGIIAKIFQGDGTKGIKVGVRIGVLAEPGDDLSTLELPAEESASPSQSKEESKTAPSETKSESALSNSSSSESSSSAPAKKPPGPAKKQTYPLLPSVEHLMHEHKIDQSKIDEMTPTGPNNRLLKGDVLAYLGTISSSYPAELSSKISKLSHLDLSNIKLAAPAPMPAAIEKVTAPTPEPVKDSQIAVPISMKAVMEVQKRIQSTLGVFMPLSTFIARATEVANNNLPRSKAYKPTTDDLFNSVLGLDKVTTATGVRGTFLPQIQAFLPFDAPRTTFAKTPAKKSDIIDVLSGSKKATPSRVVGKPLPGLSNAVNVFSLTVPKGEEKRAQIFLDRVKTVLEAEPGRLVL